MLPGLSPPIIGLVAGAVEATITASGGPQDISNFFSPSDWSGTVKKRLIIPAGIIAGGYLDEGPGRGGLLEIVVNGEIQGSRGAPNSGAGGHALYLRTPGVTLSGSGAIRGGGGGGGKGGQGGPGYYYSSEGPYWGDGTYMFRNGTFGSSIYWGGLLTTSAPAGASSYVYSGYTYYRGTFVRSLSGSAYDYYISRTNNTATYTSGGAGGNGGYGQGYGGGNTAGSAGAAGGANAGAGGTGGTGGLWGVAGSPGNTGGAGNNGGGLAGATGGAAGLAIYGSANLAANLFTGTINGALG